MGARVVRVIRKSYIFSRHVFSHDICENIADMIYNQIESLEISKRAYENNLECKNFTSRT